MRRSVANKSDMKKVMRNVVAVIFLLLISIALFIAPFVRCSGAKDPVRQQIKEESMIM